MEGVVILSLSDCKYSLNPLNQSRIDQVRLDRIRCTFKLSCNTVCMATIRRNKQLKHTNVYNKVGTVYSIIQLNLSQTRVMQCVRTMLGSSSQQCSSHEDAICSVDPLSSQDVAVVVDFHWFTDCHLEAIFYCYGFLNDFMLPTLLVQRIHFYAIRVSLYCMFIKCVHRRRF